MKKIFALLLPVLFMFSAPMVGAQTWSKKDLIKAGFKFGTQPSYNEVVYGKKIDGKLSGIVLLRDSHWTYVGYMANGEMAAPYLHINPECKYIGITEDRYSYASSRRDAMSFIVDEIYGINSSSDNTIRRLYNCTYDVNKIIASFNKFMSSGQRIPNDAWVGYVEEKQGINIINSDPENRIPAFKHTQTFTNLYNCDGVYRPNDASTNKGGLYETLNNNFNLSLFTLSFYFKPTGKNESGILLSLSRRLELFLENGEIVIKSKYHHAVNWNTGCHYKDNAWNYISITYDRNTLIISTMDGTRLARYEIPREDLGEQYITSYNFSSGGNFKGQIKDIKLTYY